MRVAKVYLSRYDWAVVGVADVRPCDVPRVMAMLTARGEDRRKAWENLTSGRRDTGLTYSDPVSRLSVLVIGEASSAGELLSTIVHEIGHVTAHIAEAAGIDVRGEEVQYLGGAVAKGLFSIFESDFVRLLRV